MKFSNQILSYALGNVINAAVPFLLLPVLTIYLTPGDFGILSLVQMLMALSLPFILMNIHGLFLIEYSRMSEDDFTEFISTMIWIPIMGFFGLELIFWLFKHQISGLFKLPLKWVMWVPFLAVMQSIPTMIPVIYQAKMQPIRYGAYKIGLTIVNIVMSLALIISLKAGWEGRMYGILYSHIIFTILGLWLLKNSNLLKLKFSRLHLLNSLRFGVPLLPHALSGTLMTMADRLFLANLLSTKEVGIYSVAFQVGSVMSLAATSINQAWVPHLYATLNGDPSLRVKRKMIAHIYKIMGLMTILALGYMCCSYLLFPVFIKGAFQNGKRLVAPIVGAFLFQGFYFMVTNFIFYTKKTYILSMVTVSSLVFSSV
jgi:O-antigen/teichoic acid export membrane protein